MCSPIKRLAFNLAEAAHASCWLHFTNLLSWVALGCVYTCVCVCGGESIWRQICISAWPDARHKVETNGGRLQGYLSPTDSHTDTQKHITSTHRWPLFPQFHFISSLHSYCQNTLYTYSHPGECLIFCRTVQWVTVLCFSPTKKMFWSSFHVFLLSCWHFSHD